ncbi:Exocyst complex component EXO70B1 [Spatholobus suberectus]|nr:Exocyst complex component EXO70B1 [Spatholobus suberectus]
MYAALDLIKVWLPSGGGKEGEEKLLSSSELSIIEIGSQPQSQGTSHSASQVDSHQAIITDTGNAIVTQHEGDALPENEHLEFPVTRICSHSQQGNSDSDNSIMARFMGCIEALKKENTSLIDTISKHVGEYLKINVVDEDQIPVQEIHADDNLVVDALPSGIINDLREAVRLMVTAGFEVECCKAYRSCRRKFLRRSVSTLWLQMQELNVGDNIDKIMEIQCWIKVLNVAARIVFPNERRLCDRIFEGPFPLRTSSVFHLEMMRAGLRRV